VIITSDDGTVRKIRGLEVLYHAASVTRQPLILTEEDRRYLTQLTRSRTAQQTPGIRAQMLLAYCDGEPLQAISDRLHVARNAVRRCSRKALDYGPQQALAD
jgi:hypothetical protein